MTVQDYARKVLKLKEEDNLVHPYETVLSAVTVQVSNDFQFYMYVVHYMIGCAHSKILLLIWD